MKISPKAKPHLSRIKRFDPDSKSRKGYLRLDMNEGVPGLPKTFIRKALSGINGAYLAAYPEYALLRSKIARHDSVKPENIYLANGSDGAIKNIFDAYISKGDKVLLTDPTFAMYPVYCDIFGARPDFVEYKSDMSFPIEEFLKKMTRSVKMAVIVNPNNPTGSVLRHKDIIKIADKASSTGTLLIIDEAYHYFYPYTSIGLVKRYNNVIILRTFSKLCGMASLRLGYAAATPGIIENLKKVKPTYDVNGAAVALALRLLDDTAVMNKMIRDLDEGRKFIVRQLESGCIDYRTGAANFILIKCGPDAASLAKRLAGEKKVLVGGPFKNSFLDGYLRVTIGDLSTMKKFWNAFSSVYRGDAA